MEQSLALMNLITAWHPTKLIQKKTDSQRGQLECDTVSAEILLVHRNASRHQIISTLYIVHQITLWGGKWCDLTNTSSEILALN